MEKYSICDLERWVGSSAGLFAAKSGLDMMKMIRIDSPDNQRVRVPCSPLELSKMIDNMNTLFFVPVQTRIFNDFYHLRCDENNVKWSGHITPPNQIIFTSL